MEDYIKSLEKELSLFEHGFKEEEKRAIADYKANDKNYIKRLAFAAFNSDIYQVRMYSVFLFGYLSEDSDILTYMKDEVSKDSNWRVQEVLARRAVVEGLRIWTSRPYFKEKPNEAIRRIANLKDDSSEYVRKSVGNALRDISKKFPDLIKIELETWKLESKEINQVYKLASKLVGNKK